jgi:hypothetical protein
VEKQDKIAQSMALHKGLASAFSRFPPEVLCRIFVYCLTETDHPEMSPELAPMLLTRICRQWREIVMNTHSLWCRLSVEHFDMAEDWHSVTFRYDLWLKRSQRRPLSLALQSYDSVTQSLLQPYKNQITSIVLRITAAHQLLSIDFPALQELTILSDHSPVDVQSILRLPFIVSSLRLKALYGFNIQQLCSSDSIWAHLTNLEVHVNNPYTFLRLLQLCLNLSSATVGLVPIKNNVLRALKPFTHTKLQFLSIGGSINATPHSLPYLFSALSLPNLRVLDASQVELRWPHIDFKAFLARSRCPLERLILGGAKTGHEERAEYMTLIPSLEIVVGPHPSWIP